MPLLSVVVPTYNEGANIGPLLQALDGVFAGVDVEYVVVDDNSKDATAQNARDASPRARVIVRRNERGLATAVVRGMKEATGTFVAVMDADFQHPPATVRAMLDRAMATEADLVIGSRYDTGGSEGSFGLARRTISKGARTIAKVALPPIRKHNLTDPMSGLFLFRRDRVKPDELKPTGYKILLEVLGRSDLRRVEEVGYVFASRREGASKLGSKVIGQYLMHVLALGLEDHENQRLLRFLLVGASGVLVNFAAVWAFTSLGWNFHLALMAAIEVSILWNFALNDRFTFKDRAQRVWIARLVMFNIVALVSATTQFLTATLLADVFGLSPLLAAAVGIVAGLVPNYVGNLRFTYGDRRRTPARNWVPVAVLALAASGLYLGGLGPAPALDWPWMDEHGMPFLNPHGNEWGIRDIYFDESYYVTVAHQMDAGVWDDPCGHDHNYPDGDPRNLDPAPLNYEHPPLAKLIMFASVHAYESYHGVFEGCRSPDNTNDVRSQPCFDTATQRWTTGPECFRAFTSALREQGNQWAWRTPSAIMGVLTVVFACLTARRLFSSHLAGVLAGSFVLLDNLILSSSRIALLDIYATGFAVIAAYFATFPTRKGVLLTALFLGLGFSSKFYVLMAAPGILLMSLWVHHRAGVLRRRRFDLHLLAYPLITLGVLLATYTPWWVTWIRTKGVGWAVSHWVALQAAAIKWDATGAQDNDFSTSPAEWLLMRTPYQYIHGTITLPDGSQKHEFIYAMGNPILWWSACLAVIYVLIDFLADWVGSRFRRHVPDVGPRTIPDLDAASSPTLRTPPPPAVAATAPRAPAPPARTVSAPPTPATAPGAPVAGGPPPPDPTFVRVRPVGFLGPLAFLAQMPRARQAVFIGALLPLLTYLGFFAISSGGRTTFLFYMTIVVPFMAIALAGVLANAWSRPSAITRTVVAVVCLLVLAGFLYVLPVTIYAPQISSETFHRIFDTFPWIQPCGHFKQGEEFVTRVCTY